MTNPFSHDRLRPLQVSVVHLTAIQSLLSDFSIYFTAPDCQAPNEPLRHHSQSYTVTLQQQKRLNPRKSLVVNHYVHVHSSELAVIDDDQLDERCCGGASRHLWRDQCWRRKWRACRD